MGGREQSFRCSLPGFSSTPVSSLLAGGWCSSLFIRCEWVWLLKRRARAEPSWSPVLLSTTGRLEFSFVSHGMLPSERKRERKRLMGQGHQARLGRKEREMGRGIEAHRGEGTSVGSKGWTGPGPFFEGGWVGCWLLVLVVVIRLFWRKCGTRKWRRRGEAGWWV